MATLPISLEAPAKALTGDSQNSKEVEGPKVPSIREGAALVARAQGGDSRAMDELIRKHTPGIYRFVLRMVRDEQDARDITQEVFLRMIRSFKRYDPSYRFETWLYRIARNLCYDRGRKAKRWKFAFWSREEEESGLDPIQSLPDPGASALDQALDSEQGSQIEEAIGKLKPAYREILLLFHYEDRSYQEIANILDIPMGTVMNRLYRSRQALKKILVTS